MMADLLQELGGAGGSDEQRCCAWMGLAGLVDGLYRHYRRAHCIFLFFILLTETGIKTTSEKVSLAVTFDPRRLSKTPQIISFARLG